MEVLDAVDNGGTDSERDTIVVRLADASNGRDVVFFEYMLGRIFEQYQPINL